MNTTQTSPSAPEVSGRAYLHNYRIGIIGAKNSGKTCLLAVLGMPHSPNPSSFSVMLEKIIPRHTVLQTFRRIDLTIATSGRIPTAKPRTIRCISWPRFFRRGEDG